MWLAGYNDGLLAFDIRTQRFSKVPDVSMVQPRHLMRDVRGRIWISDEFLGLFVLDSSSGKSEFFEHDPNDPGSLSSSNPQATYQDSPKRLDRMQGAQSLGTGEEEIQGVFELHFSGCIDCVSARE